jgi:hypothetical protein
MTVALVACGEGEETRAVCSHTAELESSLVATDFAADNLSQISPRQLQSTVAVLMGTLVIINDVSPSSIRTDVEQTIRSYEELSVALQNVYWDGSVAATDDNVQNAIDNLSRNDNVEALEGIRAFIEKQCSVEIASGINEAPGDDQSVAPTSLMIDPQPDINYAFDNEETAVRSYAYFIAAQRGIEISPAQALCLGELMMNSAIDNPAISDEAFESTLNASFEKCAISVK